MKTKRGVARILFLLFLIPILGFPGRVFCYDTNVAHPKIVASAVNLYNLEAETKLSNEEIGWIVEGAVAEDTPTRWMNHFYDPIYEKGLKWIYPTAKNWAKNPYAQTGYALGDKSWPRALDDWKEGKKEKALKSLGHTLHLVADMAVPAHTRDDVHIVGDPYEQYLKNNWSKTLLNWQNRVEMIRVNDLDTAFNDLANFSNRNFYSQDTIKITKYQQIEGIKTEVIKLPEEKYVKFGIRNFEGRETKIFLINGGADWKKTNNTTFSLEHPDISSDYSSHLLPKAVGYSAGVIDLFFKEAKKEEKTDLPLFRESIFGYLGRLFGFAAQEAIDLAHNNPDVKVDLSLNIVEPAVENLPEEKESEKEKTPVEQVKKEEKPAKKTETKSDNQTSVIPEKPKSELPIVVLPEPLILGEKVFSDVAPFPIGENLVTPPPLPMSVAPPPAIPPPATSENQNNNSGGSGGESNQTTPATTPTSTPETGNSSAANSEDQTDNVPPLAPLLGEFFSSEIFTSSSTYLITGTATSSVKSLMVFSALEEEKTLLNIWNKVGDAWSYTAELTNGKNVFYFAAIGDNAATSTFSLPVTITKDTVAPIAPVLEVAISNTTSTLALLSATSTDALSGLSEFYFQSSSDGENWLDIGESSDGSLSANIIPGSTYFFRVRVSDHVGNLSDWTANEKALLAPGNRSVILNEIAWMGTSAKNSNDEWLEFYNNTDFDIDLTGWKLEFGGKIVEWKQVSPILKARGFYLLERSDDKTVVDVPADGFFTGGIGNDGEKIFLFDAQGDLVDWIDCSSGWFAGTKDGKYAAMARKNYAEDGNDPLNWVTAKSLSTSGRTDKEGGWIYGSPKEPNEAYWFLKDLSVFYPEYLSTSGTINFKKEDGPFIIDAELEIPVGQHWLFEEGAVLAGLTQDSFLRVRGVLEFQGSAVNPVIFTSPADSEFVKYNPTKTKTGPNPGDWSRIEVTAGGKLLGQNIKFLYGGNKFYANNGWVYGKFMSQVIRNIGGEVDLSSVEFGKSFVDDSNDIRQYSALVWSESPVGKPAKTKITESVFDGGWKAIENYQAGVESVFSGNIIKNFQCPDVAVISRHSWPELDDNVFVDNISDLVDAGSPIFSENKNIGPDVNLLVGNLTILNGATLNLEPGTVLTFGSKGDFLVEGRLSALGVAENPIELKAKSSEWGSLVFKNSSSTLRHMIISGGNHSNSRDVKKSGQIVAENSAVEFENIQIKDARRPQNMIYSQNSILSFVDSFIGWSEPWQKTGKWVIIGIEALGGEIRLNNTVFERMDRGIELYSEAILKMENMTAGHFREITDLPWWPILAFSW